jgi:hypothetical protein
MLSVKNCKTKGTRNEHYARPACVTCRQARPKRNQFPELMAVEPSALIRAYAQQCGGVAN